MRMQVVGVSHHDAPIPVRERLAFGTEQVRAALARWRERFADCEIVLLSTCNRTELYAAAESESAPEASDITEFLTEFHGVDLAEVEEHLFAVDGEEAVQHLFTVAASLDSMVVGEAQILSQVKQAYQLATDEKGTGPLTHAAHTGPHATAPFRALHRRLARRIVDGRRVGQHTIHGQYHFR